MIDDVKAAFKQRLGDAEWMDAGTKHAALVKLEAITDMIGYPDYIKVGSVQRFRVRHGLSCVNGPLWLVRGQLLLSGSVVLASLKAAVFV